LGFPTLRFKTRDVNSASVLGDYFPEKNVSGGTKLSRSTENFV
jgi:hypothetical protein